MSATIGRQLLAVVLLVALLGHVAVMASPLHLATHAAPAPHAAMTDRDAPAGDPSAHVDVAYTAVGHDAPSHEPSAHDDAPPRHSAGDGHAMPALSSSHAPDCLIQSAPTTRPAPRILAGSTVPGWLGPPRFLSLLAHGLPNRGGPAECVDRQALLQVFRI